MRYIYTYIKQLVVNDIVNKERLINQKQLNNQAQLEKLR